MAKFCKCPLYSQALLNVDRHTPEVLKLIPLRTFGLRNCRLFKKEQLSALVTSSRIDQQMAVRSAVFRRSKGHESVASTSPCHYDRIIYRPVVTFNLGKIR